MPKPKHRDDVIHDLMRLVRYFREEMRTRAWGKDEYEKLLAERKAAHETVDEAEREPTRRILAAVDRTMSVRVAAECAIEILHERSGTRAIPPPLLGTLLGALNDQASLAVRDAFDAWRAACPPSVPLGLRTGERSFAKAASALARHRIRPADLQQYRRVAEYHRTRLASAFATAIRESLDAAYFLENVIRQVDRLVADAARKRAGLARTPLIHLMTFIRNGASFVQEQVAEAINQAEGGGELPATRTRRGR